MKRINKAKLRWLCTGSNESRKRCRASIETVTINGTLMLRQLGTSHICAPKKHKKDKTPKSPKSPKSPRTSRLPTLQLI